MKNSFFQETTIAGILIVVLVLLANPFDLWMPSMFAMSALAVFTSLFAVFAALVWKEQSRDEREALHRSLAGRFGFLAGATVLVAGIIVQSFTHTLDQWLVAALAAMILAKIASLAWSRRMN